MTVSIERLATLEDHMDRQLASVAGGGRRAGWAPGLGRWSPTTWRRGRTNDAPRSQLGAVRGEFAGLVEARIELSAALEHNAGGVAEVGAETGTLAARVTEMQAEIAALHRVVAHPGDTAAGLPKPFPTQRERPAGAGGGSRRRERVTGLDCQRLNSAW